MAYREYIAKCKDIVSISGTTWQIPEHIDLNVEIVRCMDCKFCMAYMACTYCDYMAHAIEPDGFCAWGERKEVNNGLR